MKSVVETAVPVVESPFYVAVQECMGEDKHEAEPSGTHTSTRRLGTAREKFEKHLSLSKKYVTLSSTNKKLKNKKIS